MADRSVNTITASIAEFLIIHAACKLTPCLEPSVSTHLSQLQIHWHIFLFASLCSFVFLCLPLSFCRALTFISFSPPHQLSTLLISLLPPPLYHLLSPHPGVFVWIQGWCRADYQLMLTMVIYSPLCLQILWCSITFVFIYAE